MKQYESGISKTFLVSIIAALVVTSGVLVVAFFGPGGVPTTTPTTTPPTTTGPPGTGYGALAARYLNSMRDNVEFFWVYNSTFVNGDLSAHYQQTEPSAFVDGVKMLHDESGYHIEVLFAPWSSNIIGQGDVTQTQWESMSGSLIDDGLAMMPDASNPPTSFPSSMPTLLVEVYFDDLSYFIIGFCDDGNVFLSNGTWTGGFRENGWPETSSYSWDNGDWLIESGYLTTPMTNMFNTITGAVSYPGAQF